MIRLFFDTFEEFTAKVILGTVVAILALTFVYTIYVDVVVPSQLLLAEKIECEKDLPRTQECILIKRWEKPANE